jgi:hypothetical protein
VVAWGVFASVGRTGNDFVDHDDIRLGRERGAAGEVVKVEAAVLGINKK